MKQIVLINGSYDFEKIEKYKIILKNISKFLKSNHIPLTIIFNKTYEQEKSDTDIDNEMSIFLSEYHLDDISDHLVDLFKNNISHVIIESILDNDDFVLKEKSESYLKQALDCVPECAFLIGKAAQFCKANYCSFTEENILLLMEDAPFFKNLTAYIMKKGNLKLSEMMDVLLYCSFDYYEANDKYGHIDIGDEILLFGGLANECLIDEYMALKLLGYKNIEVNPTYIYDGVEKFSLKDLICTQEKEFQKILMDTMNMCFENEIYKNL